MTTTTSIIPHLACRHGSEAVTFYEKAFGASPLAIHRTPDGRLMHAALSFGGHMVFVVDEFPEHGGKSPQTLGGTPVTIHMQVSDCDAVFQRAVEAGCLVKMPLEEMFWGDRYGLVEDPFGHQWSIATTVREVTHEEIEKVMADFPCPENT